MTDHLTEARAAIHAERGWSMAAPASSLADMASAVAHILDHLELTFAPRPAEPPARSEETQ